MGLGHTVVEWLRWYSKYVDSFIWVLMGVGGLIDPRAVMGHIVGWANTPGEVYWARNFANLCLMFGLYQYFVAANASLERISVLMLVNVMPQCLYLWLLCSCPGPCPWSLGRALHVCFAVAGLLSETVMAVLAIRLRMELSLSAGDSGDTPERAYTRWLLHGVPDPLSLPTYNRPPPLTNNGSQATRDSALEKQLRAARAAQGAS